MLEWMLFRNASCSRTNAFLLTKLIVLLGLTPNITVITIWAGEEGLKLSPWFRLVVDNFLMKWWDHVEKGTLDEAIDMKTIHKL
ncbi:BnaAnng12740D [Brassica napus]|uniref:BnaAnng12740D protein n=1 Tax=Brassica napus TaxID=3708 RepID=A0A078IV22_BRANA|nr:BnaAnng12740D [Brassica napus]